jgi:hypothetical protein
LPEFVQKSILLEVVKLRCEQVDDGWRISWMIPLKTPHPFYMRAVSRVARWFIFKPKKPLWVKFLGPWTSKGRNIL